MFKRIDRSPSLSRLLEQVSTSLAQQRGLPVIIGLVFIIVAFIVQIVSIAFPSPLLELVWAIALHVGLIIALIGLLLVQPLGQ